jgi:hypothetical protein
MAQHSHPLDTFFVLLHKCLAAHDVCAWLYGELFTVHVNCAIEGKYHK